MIDADAALEVQINRAYEAMCTASDPDDQGRAYQRMVNLVRQRSATRPTHHAGVHLFLAKKPAWPNTSGFSSDETDKLIEIALPAHAWISAEEVTHAA